jgi:hypothetical protein
VKVVFASLFLTRPTDQFIAALEASVPLVEAAGWEHGLAVEVGNPYISAGRASLARKALDAKADVIVYLDYDRRLPLQAGCRGIHGRRVQ